MLPSHRAFATAREGNPRSQEHGIWQARRGIAASSRWTAGPAAARPGPSAPDPAGADGNEGHGFYVFSRLSLHLISCHIQQNTYVA